MNTSIEIAISCFWFQKRLCWMLSSILQQQGNLPDIIFNVAYFKDHGNPITEDVVNFFRREGLNIKETIYETERDMQYRGLVRNRQLAETSAEWMLFSDSDMTYSPLFFDDLREQIEGPLRSETKCISAGRISLAKDFCKDYFNNLDKRIYPCVVEGAGELEHWPIYQYSRNVGAGYFQLTNVKSTRELYGGIYVDPKKCRDLPSVDKMQKARSDRQFRNLVGGLRKINTKPEYHLNHERDNEIGYHIRHQR